jgi:hypothetical protein
VNVVRRLTPELSWGGPDRRRRRRLPQPLVGCSASLGRRDRDSYRTSTARSKQYSAWRSWTSMKTCSSDAMATVRVDVSYVTPRIVSTYRPADIGTPLQASAVSSCRRSQRLCVGGSASRIASHACCSAGGRVEVESATSRTCSLGVSGAVGLRGRWTSIHTSRPLANTHDGRGTLRQPVNATSTATTQRRWDTRMIRSSALVRASYSPEKKAPQRESVAA